MTTANPGTRRSRRAGVLFVSWLRYHGRSDALADAVGAQSYFVHPRVRLLPLRYAIATVRTLAKLLRSRPSVVFVMQPPAVALLPVLLYAAAFDARIVADLHSGTFNDRRWRWASRWVIRAVRRRGLFLVTNRPLAQSVVAQGGNALVLHDPAMDLRTRPVDTAVLTRLAQDADSLPYALFPVTYAPDEPITQILRAARSTPDIRFVLTGSAPETVVFAAPANVSFPGYVSNEEYLALARNAACMFALTDRSCTMQRAAYEAEELGTPVVVSDQEVLREYFGDAAVYTDNSAPSIGSAARRATSGAGALRRRLGEARQAHVVAEQGALSTLRAWIHDPRQVVDDPLILRPAE